MPTSIAVAVPFVLEAALENFPVERWLVVEFLSIDGLVGIQIVPLLYQRAVVDPYARVRSQGCARARS